MAALAPAGSVDGSVELTAPSAPGTYYYGACVDAVAGEADTANNCSPSVQLTVPDPPPPPQEEPDLVVAAPSVTESRPTAGTFFTLTTTVRNDGNGDAHATTVRWYRSTDAAITTADTEVGAGAVAALAPAGSAGGSVELTAPSAPGTYYYGACVDAVSGEADTANNCSTSVQVTVPDPPPPPREAPDLVVAPPSATNSRLTADAAFTLSATVRNYGAGNAPATTLRYYRSTDAAITTADTEVGAGAVAALAPSGSAGGAVDLTAPSDPGTYYYGACVDAVAGEKDTSNNCSTAVQVEVVGPLIFPGTVADQTLRDRSGHHAAPPARRHRRARLPDLFPPPGHSGTVVRPREAHPRRHAVRARLPPHVLRRDRWHGHHLKWFHYHHRIDRPVFPLPRER